MGSAPRSVGREQARKRLGGWGPAGGTAMGIVRWAQAKVWAFMPLPGRLGWWGSCHCILLKADEGRVLLGVWEEL